MDSGARHPVRSALVLVFGLYFAIAGIFFVPYYNWQYAREHGFMSWLFLGEIIATGKALAWPYFMLSESFTSSTATSPLPPKWSADEVANSKHFWYSIQADLQSKKLSRQRTGAELSASERREILMLKETALQEIRLVSPSTLRKIHPDLPHHVAAEYIPALEYLIRNLTLTTGDAEAERQGIALFDTWALWWNANRDAIYIPK